MKYKIIGSIIAILLYCVGVYLSGWQFERNCAAVFIYIYSLIAAFGGFVIGSLIEIDKE